MQFKFTFVTYLTYSKKMSVLCRLRQVLVPCPCSFWTYRLDASGKDTRKWIPNSFLTPFEPATLQ